MAVRPRVVHLTTVHHPLDPRIYAKEACSLSRAGFDVWLVARASGIDRLDGVHFVGLPGGTGRGDRLRRQADARRELGTLRPDVLHVHDPELLPLARWAKSRLGIKIVYDKHEHYAGRPGLEGWMLERLESWAFGWIDFLILAEKGYTGLVGNHDVPRETILNYALEPKNGTEVEGMDSRDGLRIVYTGTISKGRGLFRMLDLAGRLKERQVNASIEIVGICNYPKQRLEAEKQIRSAGLESIVSVEGWDQYAGQEAMETALRRAHIGIMLAEPLQNYTVSIPTKFYEYLQYGLPMLVEDLAGWREFVDQTGAGVAVDSRNPDEVLDAVVSLSEPDRFVSCRSNALRAAPDYRWTQMEARLVEVYSRMGLSVP